MSITLCKQSKQCTRIIYPKVSSTDGRSLFCLSEFHLFRAGTPHRCLGVSTASIETWCSSVPCVERSNEVGEFDRESGTDGGEREGERLEVWLTGGADVSLHGLVPGNEHG